MKKSAKLFKVGANISPHSLRKIYAVEEYEKSGGNLKKVKALLNHENEAVTILYAMANELNRKKRFK